MTTPRHPSPSPALVVILALAILGGGGFLLWKAVFRPSVGEYR